MEAAQGGTFFTGSEARRSRQRPVKNVTTGADEISAKQGVRRGGDLPLGAGSEAEILVSASNLS